MLSLFKPCGLSELITLQYGTVPLVRAIRALVVTVFDPRTTQHATPANATATFFASPASRVLESAMARAIGLWYIPLPGPVRPAHADRDAATPLLHLAPASTARTSATTSDTKRTALACQVKETKSFCRLAANRAAPADLDLHVTGDSGRAAGVLAAASALALD